MVHKSGTLTNLQMALLNAIALQSLIMAANAGGVGGWLSDGGSVYITTDLIARRTGYSKLTSYHHKLLIQLAKDGHLKEFWFSRKRKGYSITPATWSFLGLMIIEKDTQTIDMFGDKN